MEEEKINDNIVLDKKFKRYTIDEMNLIKRIKSDCLKLVEGFGDKNMKLQFDISPSIKSVKLSIQEFNL